MADKTTIARPYAQAAFDEARHQQALGRWLEGLVVAAQVVADPRVAKLIGNPHVTSAELAQLVIDVAGPRLDELGRNFVRTLAENHRLEVLPEISELFEQLKDEAEGTIDVTVTSAASLDEARRATLAAALERRFRRRVQLTCEVDPALIGGAVLRAGDMVIDGSLKSRLERLAYQLTA
jgi:F-type H+-transporting ATPase subunit delta